MGVISTPIRKSTILASNGIDTGEEGIKHLSTADASLKNESGEEKGLTSRENSATKKSPRSPATFYRTQGSLPITRAELSPVRDFTKIKPKKEPAKVCRAKSGATRLPIEEAIDRSFEKTPPPHSVDPDLLASAEEMLRAAENPVEASRVIREMTTTATVGSSGSDDGSVTTHPGLISKHDQGDGLVEAAADTGAGASNMVTEELMRKMQDELLTEITRTSKMDRIKMTATLKKELAKSKEEQVSITETPPVKPDTATTDDLTTAFTRVVPVLRELQDHVRRGQYDQAWMSIIGKKLDDLVTLDLRDLVASNKQSKQER